LPISFQYLIGSIETVIGRGNLPIFYEFQYLIGSIETVSRAEIHPVNFMFQYLIGSIETSIITDATTDATGSNTSLVRLKLVLYLYVLGVFVVPIPHWFD